MIINARHCLAGALWLLVATTAPCFADDDDYNYPESLKPGAIELCKPDSRLQKTAPCTDGSFDRLAKDIDAAAKAALAKARPITVPLLKRDQVWFGEMIAMYAGDAVDAAAQGEDWQKRILDNTAAQLRQRIATLNGVAQGLGRAGVAGRWANAFGTVEVAPDENGAYRVTLSGHARYGVSDDDLRQTCEATAIVRPGTDGWLAGDAIAAAGDPKPDGAGERTKPALLRIRRQGETLRVLAGNDSRDDWDYRTLHCSRRNLLTGSYFAVGNAGAAANAAAAPFVAPTFDCANPGSSAEEEICADPELAANDVRLNRDWKRLLPRLDAATRRYLTADQNAWVKSQANQFIEFLHPAWDKQTSDVHQTAYGRDQVDRLQRERIAVLEGFDEKRRGFEGLWWADSGVLTVTRGKDSTLKATGRKWFQGDWKAGCDYEFTGTADGDVFHPADKSKNPDSMVRDHATLIVNPTDDEFAKHRYDDRHKADVDEAKCKRRLDVSSTLRLFPVRASPDLNGLDDSIR